MLRRAIQLVKPEYVKAETGQDEGSRRPSCANWKGKTVLSGARRMLVERYEHTLSGYAERHAEKAVVNGIYELSTVQTWRIPWRQVWAGLSRSTICMDPWQQGHRQTVASPSTVSECKNG